MIACRCCKALLTLPCQLNSLFAAELVPLLQRNASYIFMPLPTGTDKGDKLSAKKMSPRAKLWHGAQLGLPAVSRRLRRLSFFRKRIRPKKNRYRLLILFVLLVCLFITMRRFGIAQRIMAHYLSGGDPLPPNYVRGNAPGIDGFSSDGSGEGSYHLWRRLDRNCPAETKAPDSRLYGTGGEVCYTVGKPDNIHYSIHSGDPAPVWQMNSRAFCVNSKPSCLYGNRLENFLTFERRGSSSCKVISISNSRTEDIRKRGLNESCAAFRQRQITSMYGKEVFSPYDKWYESVTKSFKAHPTNKTSPIHWASQFAIVVPKYQWSYNIYHYFRIWSNILWIVRNLRLYVPDANRIHHIHILYRMGYKYKLPWHGGIRDTVIDAVRRELGITLTVGKLRYNSDFGFQCLHRSIWLGREGSVDSFLYHNDSKIWVPLYQKKDDHWPIIPHESLWFRQVVSTWTRLPPVGSFRGDIPSHFDTIPVPPRRVGILLRSPKSKRRLTRNGETWFRATLHELAIKHGLETQNVRTSASMSFKEQVEKMRNLGLAVGLHGANFVNSIFMPAASALFEIFPFRYVRYYYAAGSNSGLRYSFHEAEGGVEKNCSLLFLACVVKYRESVIYLSTKDRINIRRRIDNAMAYIVRLHEMYPDGYIPLRRDGNLYHFGE